MTVRELLARIDSRELAEWMEYYELNPFGEARADLRMGIIASTQANCHRRKGKAFKPADFIPRFDRPQTRGISPGATKGIFAGYAAAMAANTKEKPKP